jgi:hypothetical protein
LNYIIIENDPKGTTAIVQKDNVAECTAYAQRRVKQKYIEPKFLTISEVREVNIEDLRRFHILYLEKILK